MSENKQKQFAVIFKTKRQLPMPEDYGVMSLKLEELVKRQPGFLRIESFDDANGNGVSISYWESLDSIRAWRENSMHLEAQAKGKSDWYKSYEVEICEVLRSYKSPSI